MSNRDIIVIGGSAGATTPLKALVQTFPADLEAAVFVVLHTPARSLGILSTVLAAAGKLPVVQSEDGMAVRPGHIYLAVPDRHLLVRDGAIRLGRGPRENMARPAIDPLFRSAAIAYGARVVGVILSGFLNDGADGLAAVKRCGGLAIVQDPIDAVASEMPQSAMDATAVDVCVPGARLGDVLSDIVKEQAGTSLPIPPELRIEVDIAAGERVDSEIMQRIADPMALSCPACGGVLSGIRDSKPLRFRCQVGHGYTAAALAQQQESSLDEAMRVALRIIEERAELVLKMAEDARRNHRPAVVEMYEDRGREYRTYAETLRKAVIASLDFSPPAGPKGGEVPET